MRKAALRFYSGQHYAAWVYPDHIRTILWDGSETNGYPLDTDDFRDSARTLGYGDDVLWHMIEHDLAHSWLAEMLGLGHSIALWNQAHDRDAWLKTMPGDAKVEEYRVGALQASLNGRGWGRDRLREAIGERADEIITEAAIVFRPNGFAMTKEWAAGLVYSVCGASWLSIAHMVQRTL